MPENAKPDCRDEQGERQRLLTRFRAFRQVDDMPPRGDLRAEDIWRREYSAHTEIKVAYDGEVDERIPAYLLIPRIDKQPPFPAVLAIHQCACQCDIGKEQVVGKCIDWPDQAYGLELVRQGFVVLAPDANKIGERYDPALRKPWQTAHDEEEKRRCCTAPGGPWGPIRWKSSYDVMRGIDFLCQHDLVDESRIGVIGHSLGADTIIWTMPLDERIRAAAISGGGLVAPEPGFTPYGMPYSNVLKLIAPRPFLEVTGVHDYGNCGDATCLDVAERMCKKRAAHEAARNAYVAAGAPSALACFEHDGAHCFPEQGRQEAYAWLKRWLIAETEQEDGSNKSVDHYGSSAADRG